METATGSMAIGVNLIVKNFLVTHVGANPMEMKTEITEDVLVVLIRGLLPPAESEMLSRNGITVVSYQQLREQLFKKSEPVLRERVADFLQRSIKSIHYIFGTQPEDMSIIIYLERF